MKTNPPQLPFRLLRWFCKPWYVETIEGDLLELYERWQATRPVGARWRLYANVLGFCRWRYLKNAEDFFPKSSIGMFKTYFKVSLRNMRKNTTQATLNIFGLAVGIACCLLMIMHVNHQLKYDQHIPDLERIYRITLNAGGPYTPARLVSQMRQEYPEVATGARVSGPFDGVIELDGRYLKQTGGLMADSTFFELFPAQFLKGDSRYALNQPNSVVLTETLASTFFPDTDPVGRTIKSSGEEYTITAVVTDPPATTTVPYSFIVSVPRAHWATHGWWTGNNFFSYIKLNEGTNPQVLEGKMIDFVERHIGPEILSFRSQYQSFDEYLADGNRHFFTLIPLKEIHLNHPRLTLGTPGSYQNILLFSFIAAFILIIACINYINMSTARASLRAKEIGMRKVMGSVKSLIAQQFFLEAFLITGIGALVGFALAWVCLPYFNQLSQGGYTLGHLLAPRAVGWMLLILLVAALLSGSYPALYLSSFKPISALRGERIRGGSRQVRAGLVVFQFAISLFLIAATFIVYRQVSLMTNRNLGLDASQVYAINGAAIADHYPAFKNQLLANTRIEQVGMANSYMSSFLADWNYRTVGDHQVSVSPFNVFVSAEMAEVWGLELLKGRFFDESRATDTATVVINAQLAKALGWEEPIGQVISRGEGEDYRVIGVVDDFATGSAKRGNAPVIFRYLPPERIARDYHAVIMVKIAGNYQESLAIIEKTWDAFIPGYPMDGIFMSDSFQRLYEGERRFGMLFSGFSTVAIFIACIGLFALAAFTLERKRKEIALRKVMGARVGQLFMAICGHFARLMAWGAVIALPLVFYLGNNWLEAYAERISIGVSEFLIPVGALVVIALLTVSYQVYQAAISNPVEALKEE